MLELAELADGHTVLEVGTGTGFHAGLLAARLGDDAVTTVEVDAELAAGAKENLARAGFHPRVEWADGAAGWPAAAPYDLLLATCSVRTVPAAWLNQVRPGGRIITPWDAAWCPYGTLVLTTRPDGTADGHFSAGGSYMPLRHPGALVEPDIDLARDILRTGDTPTETATALSPWNIAGEDLNAQFAIAQLVPGVWHSWDTEPAADGAAVRLWLADDAATSWAAIDYDGHQQDRFRALQHGPRRLVDEVDAAYSWWTARGRPPVGHFGVTASPDGGHSVWLESPDHPVPTPGRATPQPVPPPAP